MFQSTNQKIVISPGFSQGLQWDFPLAQSLFGYDGEFLMGIQVDIFSGKPSGKLTFTDLPGLVNVNKQLWKDPPFSMGKSTISTGPFFMSQTVTNYQRVLGYDYNGRNWDITNLDVDGCYSNRCYEIKLG